MIKRPIKMTSFKRRKKEPRLKVICFSEKNLQIFKMSAGLFALMSKKGREDRRLKELRDAFDAADKDKDGQLTPNEWFGVLKQTGVDVSK